VRERIATSLRWPTAWGHRAGEVASFIATALLGRLGSEDPLEGVIRRANRSKVAAQGDEELAGMGTTVVALRFSETQEGPVAEVAARRSATPGSTAEVEVSGGVRSRSQARRGVHLPPGADAQ
jgi:hypothetical protein